MIFQANKTGDNTFYEYYLISRSFSAELRKSSKLDGKDASSKESVSRRTISNFGHSLPI